MSLNRFQQKLSTREASSLFNFEYFKQLLPFFIIICLKSYQPEVTSAEYPRSGGIAADVYGDGFGNYVRKRHLSACSDKKGILFRRKNNNKIVTCQFIKNSKKQVRFCMMKVGEEIVASMCQKTCWNCDYSNTCEDDDSFIWRNFYHKKACKWFGNNVTNKANCKRRYLGRKISDRCCKSCMVPAVTPTVAPPTATPTSPPSTTSPIITPVTAAPTAPPSTISPTTAPVTAVMTNKIFQDACFMYRVKGYEKAVETYGELCSWQTSKVKEMSYCFSSVKIDARKEVDKLDLSSWDVGRVKDMQKMFKYAGSFYSELSEWDVSKVTKTEDMFLKINFFNSELNSWDTSRLTNSVYMFAYANGFNQDLSSWQMHNIIKMQKMVGECPKFNSDLSNWDTSKTMQMSSLFINDVKFNSDISGWDTSNVIYARKMFIGTKSFDCTFRMSWDLSSLQRGEKPLSCGV